MASSGTVCVTGASGFIASWLVKQLLEKGYTVRATVRDVAERLQLVKADLLTEGDFNEAVKGCSGVFHTASPFFTSNITDPQAQLLDPAVKGTMNLMRAVAATTGIKRVVLTSSVASVQHFQGKDVNTPLNESFWSTEEFCREKKMWYPLSKLQAEKAAWDFAKEHNIDLVTINPGMVVGKLLQPTLNTSSEIILKYLKGENKTYPNSTMGWVHVEDVAEAHVLALEKPEANGRYLLVASWVHFKDICAWLKHIVPDAPIPDTCVDDQPKATPQLVDNAKIRNLGLSFKNIETMLRDAVTSLQENGFTSAHAT